MSADREKESKYPESIYQIYIWSSADQYSEPDADQYEVSGLRESVSSPAQSW